MTNKKDNTNNVAFSKIKQSLASNFYSILSPPPCQVEEQETTISNLTIEQGQGSITFPLPSTIRTTTRLQPDEHAASRTGGMPKPIKPLSIPPSKPPTDRQLTNLPPSQTTATSVCTSTTTKNSDKAFLINQSPPPLLTMVQPPALARPLTHSYQQANSPTKSFVCPTGPRKQQARLANLRPTCEHLRTMSTSPRALPNYP